ncbi:MAG: hypothetical protein D8H98_01530 [Prevotella sp.]|nr:MAG: hypothetical protein D8H98_01530 [Prevotella sp.]
MKDCLELTCRGTRLSIPNAWEQLSEGLFVRLTAHLAEMQAGRLSPGEVGVRFVCDALGCDWRRLRNEDAIANLICIAERLTFIFRIEYPDNNAILAHLPKAERHLCLHTDPFHLQLPIARKLRTMNYRYALDLCFCAQLIPKVTVQGHEYAGYTVNTAYGSLTCSLTALQYIEARTLLAANGDALPLLAAILYFPGSYNSERAHALAAAFASLPHALLAAIALNFQALNTYLFTRTEFGLLTQFVEKPAHPITTDAADALYDLSADGLGDAAAVEQINVITYLRILRKKTIEAVRTLHGMDYDAAKISTETGLPIGTIKEIV